MAQKRKDTIRPAISPEARENQLVSLAVDLAEQQLLEGTASSQVITHYLKLGSSKEKIEQGILQQKQALLEAQIKQINSSQNVEALYKQALDAMRKYGGHGEEVDELDE